MAKDFGVPIYTLDLRNHGSSPHADSMTYTDMAEDVQRFFEDRSLTDCALIGHSLGGKVAMAMALSPERPSDMLSHLVSVDMSPAEGPISKEFMQYAHAMRDIEKAGVKQRSEADEILQKTEPSLPVRQR
ncbi:ribonuclease III [Malassezia obtusa]|uniref:Ribonuclease III n=1 Tax=Malassezia obtusa TaxID=76774 RepID=A0AAF0DZ48_9BASI|nr:ribonuclease III [Malassezia obtusa]